MEQLLHRLGTAYCPAFVLGRRTDVLAINRLASALITDFGNLTVSHQAMALAGEDDQTLFVCTTPADTADETALRLLAALSFSTTSLAAGRRPAAGA
ncbi:hypothetical protein J2X68_000991 [Streptomyces sp. 3330]|uniref:MmyB family transcriptional regulator n=1 Tax=Streptomyces sp. 3330 TaxID=2817755 RepID=UPI00286111DB|nr:hypothetical protein [Streptomyces sp. 3330]MDR6974313.1 hypothetical protein [Streptomyces sp. 3330]